MRRLTQRWVALLLALVAAAACFSSFCPSSSPVFRAAASSPLGEFSSSPRVSAVHWLLSVFVSPCKLYLKTDKSNENNTHIKCLFRFDFGLFYFLDRIVNLANVIAAELAEEGIAQKDLALL